MPDVVLVLVATVLVFLVGAVYYALLGSRLVAAGSAGGGMPPAAVAVEVLRCLVLAAVVTGLATRIGADTVLAGLVLGLVLWVGFPLVLWAGAVLHERTPWRLAAIHAGDWLLKLLVLGALVGLWT